MTIEEAVRQIRREAGRLGSAVKVLEQIQRAIEAPAEEEVRQMEAGARPLSAEAHLMGVLLEALRGLENVESDLRCGPQTHPAAAGKEMERRWTPERGGDPGDPGGVGSPARMRGLHPRGDRGCLTRARTTRL